MHEFKIFIQVETPEKVKPTRTVPIENETLSSTPKTRAKTIPGQIKKEDFFFFNIILKPVFNRIDQQKPLLHSLQDAHFFRYKIWCSFIHVYFLFYARFFCWLLLRKHFQGDIKKWFHLKSRG